MGGITTRGAFGTISRTMNQKMRPALGASLVLSVTRCPLRSHSVDVVADSLHSGTEPQDETNDRSRIEVGVRPHGPSTTQFHDAWVPYWRNRSAVFAGAPTMVVRDGGPALTRPISAAEVTQGCDGCWLYDGPSEQLYVTVRNDATLVIQ